MTGSATPAPVARALSRPLITIDRSRTDRSTVPALICTCSPSRCRWAAEPRAAGPRAEGPRAARRAAPRAVRPAGACRLRHRRRSASGLALALRLGRDEHRQAPDRPHRADAHRLRRLRGLRGDRGHLGTGVRRGVARGTGRDREAQREQHEERQRRGREDGQARTLCEERAASADHFVLATVTHFLDGSRGRPAKAAADAEDDCSDRGRRRDAVMPTSNVVPPTIAGRPGSASVTAPSLVRADRRVVSAALARRRRAAARATPDDDPRSVRDADELDRAQPGAGPRRVARDLEAGRDDGPLRVLAADRPVLEVDDGPVAAVAAVDEVEAPVARRDEVVAGVAVERVAARAAVDRVVAEAAVDRVRAAVALELVVAVGAEDVLDVRADVVPVAPSSATPLIDTRTPVAPA